MSQLDGLNKVRVATSFLPTSTHAVLRDATSLTVLLFGVNACRLAVPRIWLPGSQNPRCCLHLLDRSEAASILHFSHSRLSRWWAC